MLQTYLYGVTFTSMTDDDTLGIIIGLADGSGRLAL